MSEQKSDAVVVLDRASRRRFIRNGAVFLLTGTSIVAAPSAYADCDGQPKQIKKCSDSDTGSGADSSGCGRCGRSDAIPSHYSSQPESDKPVTVARIKLS